MTRTEVLGKAEAFIDRVLADAARDCMTSLILREADCDLDDAAASIAEYNADERERMLRLVEAALDDLT